MVKVKQTEKVKKERNSSSCANREQSREEDEAEDVSVRLLLTYAQFIPNADVELVFGNEMFKGCTLKSQTVHCH